MSELSLDVERAAAFCVGAHCAIRQKRKYTGEDYWHHPVEVMVILSQVVPGASEAMHVAALLHDVVEDTGVTLETVKDLFGETVATYVEQLTDVSKPEDGNRAARKAIDLAHTALASPEAKSIKLADLISNSRSIIERDPVFAVTYLAEKRALLEVLKEGDPELHRIASELARG
ncbi:HD domain-containing protein [Pseudomonas tolaasii]